MLMGPVMGPSWAPTWAHESIALENETRIHHMALVMALMAPVMAPQLLRHRLYERTRLHF